MKPVAFVALSAVFATFVHCGGSPDGAPSTGAPSAAAAPSAPAPAAPAGDAATSSAPMTDGGAAPASSDPSKDGPYAISEIDATAHVDATGDDVPIHAAFPASGPAPGPFPVVVVAHGFQLPASQYYGYVKRLATHGYVALTADYPAGFSSSNNENDASDLVGALDWALAAPALGGKADASKAGVMGHSRGGKAAVLAAVKDARFEAVLGLDPVDSRPPFGGCDAKTECPDASDAMATLAIPSAFLGETTDATAGGFGQACAPAADDYATFFASARSPSLEVTIAGANHMSFLDDPSSCGLTCSVCNAATAPHDAVTALAYAMTVAFFDRHLRGVAAADAYLAGAEAQSRYVATGLATIRTK